MDNQQSYKNQVNNEEETIDLRRIFNYFTGNLHWFIISVVFALAVAFVINRYATRIFNISTTVLIEDDNKSTPWLNGSGPGMDITQGFGMFPSLQNFENQTIILQSYSQIRRTIDQLDFEVSYFGKGRVTSREIYTQSPFEVIFNPTHPQPLGIGFNITINNDGKIDISSEGEEATLFNYNSDEFLNRETGINFSKTVNPGEPVTTDFCDFYIKINENFDPEAESNNYIFYFNSPHHLTLLYQGMLTIEPMTKGSSMIKISLQDANPQKAMDFLNQLTWEYLNRNLEKKNEFARNTIDFIDTQLDTIKRTLTIAEEDLQDFRSKNKVMDLSFQAQQVFEQMQKLENQKMELDLQIKYYEYLLNYIQENQDIESILAPSAMGVQDQLLNQLILEINQLSVQKSSLTNVKKGADFALIKQLDAQIRNAKDNISENANNLVKSTEITRHEVQKRINQLAASINNLPETERQLFGIQREFQLNDNLYTFLLQRRAEAQIAKASNTPDNEIIDTAMVSNNGYPIKPKTMINYIIALLLGFALPAVFIALKEYFNMRIDSPDMVKRITQRPIIGYIPNSGAEADSNIFADLDSPWAEAFRIVRTKLQFFIKEKNNPVIMVTSSVPSEGKSFVAINLASAYALTGKKTVLVGYDLRRPQLAQRFKLDKNIGVTNYLIKESSLEEIIQKTQDPNLDLIASGTVPPNPAELIADILTTELLNELKKRYEFIILDTAPISPVSDSHHLSRIVDSTLFVIRNGMTHKQALQNSMEELDNSQVDNLCLVMNDIKLARKRYGGKYGYSYGYRYGYKYGYGYGYGYYREKGKKKKKKKK